MIRHTEVDRIVHRGLRTYSTSYRDACAAHGDLLAGQVLASLRQAAPVLTKDHDHRTIDAVLGALMDIPEYARLRRVTRLHTLESALATDALLAALPPQRGNQTERGEDPDADPGENGDPNGDPGENGENGDGEPGDGEGGEGDDGDADGERGAGDGKGGGKGDTGDGGDGGDGEGGANGGRGHPPRGDYRSTVRKAAQAAVGAAEAGSLLAELDEPPDTDRTGYGLGRAEPVRQTAARVEAIRSIAKEGLGDAGSLASMLRLLGALRRIESGFRRAQRGGTGAVSGVECGANPAGLLPEELARLAHPVLRRDVLRRYCERSLAQYRQHGHDRAGRGPVIALVDQSGSMTYVEKGVLATALVLSLARQCRRESRDLIVIPFGYEPRAAYRWIRGQCPAEQVNALLAESYGRGGTCFTPALRAVCRELDAARAHRRPDVIWITDGCSEIDDGAYRGIRDRVRRWGLRVLGILLAEDDDRRFVARRLKVNIPAATAVYERERAEPKSGGATFTHVCDRWFHLPMPETVKDLTLANRLFADLYTL